MATVRESTVRLLRRSRLGARLVAPLALLGRNGYLHEVGWLRSAVARQAIDGRGHPLPWLTYPAIHLLEQRCPATVRVFEYGSGNSTLWWAERARHVVAVEHYRPWFARMESRVPANVDLAFRPQEPVEEYAGASRKRRGGFEVLVIDGRRRVACAAVAPDALADGGVIVFDDTERERYRPALERLAAGGFRRLDLRGMRPMHACGGITSVLYRDGNCLGL